MKTSKSLAAIAAVGLFACGAVTVAQPAHAKQSASIANPASTFCVSQGGRSVLRGSTGYCVFPDGRSVEEWAYFRQHENDGAVGSPNPADQHCASIGGRNITTRDRNGGEASMCRLRNGRTVDAWRLFRESQRNATESEAARRFCVRDGGRLIPNDDGTNGCRTREGDVFGAQQYFDMHNRRR